MWLAFSHAQSKPTEKKRLQEVRVYCTPAKNTTCIVDICSRNERTFTE